MTEEAKCRINIVNNWDELGARADIAETKHSFARSIILDNGGKYDPTDEDFHSTDRRVAKGLAIPGFYTRPIEEPIKSCWAQRVLLLSALYRHFIEHSLYSAVWAKRVAEETKKRLEVSRSPDWTNDSSDKLPASWNPALQHKMGDEALEAGIKSTTDFTDDEPNEEAAKREAGSST